MGSFVYIIGAVVVFLAATVWFSLTARYHDTAGEIVGVAFILGATWPLAAVAGVVVGVALALLAPFWLLSKALMRTRGF